MIIKCRLCGGFHAYGLSFIEPTCPVSSVSDSSERLKTGSGGSHERESPLDKKTAHLQQTPLHRESNCVRPIIRPQPFKNNTDLLFDAALTDPQHIADLPVPCSLRNQTHYRGLTLRKLDCRATSDQLNHQG